MSEFRFNEKYFSLNCIDWEQPNNNLFQVTAEFPVLLCRLNTG